MWLMLRFLLIDASDSSTIWVSEGDGFESYDGYDTLSDGDYLLGAMLKVALMVEILEKVYDWIIIWYLIKSGSYQ